MLRGEEGGGFKEIQESLVTPHLLRKFKSLDQSPGHLSNVDGKKNILSLNCVIYSSADSAECGKLERF